MINLFSACLFCILSRLSWQRRMHRSNETPYSQSTTTHPTPCSTIQQFIFQWILNPPIACTLLKITWSIRQCSSGWWYSIIYILKNNDFVSSFLLKASPIRKGQTHRLKKRFTCKIVYVSLLRNEWFHFISMPD